MYCYEVRTHCISSSAQFPFDKGRSVNGLSRGLIRGLFECETDTPASGANHLVWQSIERALKGIELSTTTDGTDIGRVQLLHMFKNTGHLKYYYVGSSAI
jgi:hypothetical protein